MTVSATVSEYYPGGASTGVQSVTELGKPVVTVLSSGNQVPAPVVLSGRNIPGAYAPQAAGGNIEPLTLQPKKYALDLYESLEGMNVEVDNARVVGPTDPYSELWVTAKPKQDPTARGGTIYEGYDNPNSGRIQVQSLIPLAQQAFPEANVGDELTGATTGPLDYNQYGGYTIVANSIGTLASGGLAPEVTAKQRKDQLALATYNVENLAPSDPDSKFAALASGVVGNLSSPDIVALEEIQDNDGATDDGVVACDQTVQKFIAAIQRGRRPGLLRGARSTRSTTRTAASPAATSARSSSTTRPGSRFDDRPGGDVDHRRSASPRSAARRSSPPRPAGSTRPTPPGPTAASRWSASSRSRARRSS